MLWYFFLHGYDCKTVAKAVQGGEKVREKNVCRCVLQLPLAFTGCTGRAYSGEGKQNPTACLYERLS